MPSPNSADLVAAACELVTMEVAAELVGVSTRSGKSKVRCPFGEFAHSDGGDEPSLRIYPDNKAWCFACEKMWTPVSLCADVWDTNWETAAQRLLEHVGWRPGDYTAAWERATAAAVFDTSQLALALTTRLARIHTGWEVLQYDTDVAECLAKCLALLTLVKDEAQARQWLEGCAAAVAAVLARRNDATAGCSEPA